VEQLTRQVEQLSQALADVQAAQAQQAQDTQATTEPVAPVAEPAETTEEAAPVVEYNPATGLHFRPAPERFELTMRGFLWARYTYVASGAAGNVDTTTNAFSMPQARLRFVASMAGGLVQAVFQPSVAPGWAGIQDGFLELRLAPWANLRVGKQLVNYDWESNTAPPVMPVVGLSPLVGFFGHGRDMGAMFYGTAAGRLHYRLGIFNGTRSSANEDEKFLVAAMLRYQILGSLAPGWGWTDLYQSREFNATVGASGTYDAFDGALPAPTDTVPDQTFGYAAQQWQTTANLHLRYYGVSLVYVLHAQGRHFELDGAELLAAEALGIDGKDAIFSLGNLVHLGYVPWRERLEIFGRFTYLDHDVDVDTDPGVEAAGGFTFFLLGQNAKLTAQYAYQRNMPVGPHSAVGADREAHVVLVEAQGWF
jgi:hypothetical protein